MKHVKFKTVGFSNKKKQISLTYTSGKEVVIHYGQLGIKDNISDIWIDKETRGRSLGIEFADGHTDYMPYDQPLALVKDPDFILQNQIENIIAQIVEVLKERKISKHYLALQLKTSDNQVQRLLNPRFLNKNLTQLYKMAAILNLEFDLRLRAAA